MPIITSFRGLRYDPKHVGALSQVIAPPYDAIDEVVQRELYERHPANAVRLERNRDEPGDEGGGERHTRAARFLREWREQGVLMEEPAAALYVCHQAFAHEGQSHVRRGLIARVRLEPFGTGSIRPHLETTAEPREDRLQLMRACRANLSPVFGIYPDDGGEVQAVLDAAVAGQPPIEAIGDEGVTNRLWPVTDEGIATRVAGLLGSLPVVVADGHHRYETACRYRDEVAARWEADHAGAPLPAEHPANFVLMLLVGMHDSGLVSVPVHGLFTEPQVASAADLAKRLGGCFTTRTLWRGPEAAETVWSYLEFEGEQGVLGIYTAGDRAWSLARITPAGQARLEALAADRSPAWRRLGTAILHRLLLDDLLAGGHAPGVYVSQLGVVSAALADGRHALAALMLPATVADIRAISEAGDRLPARSTRFHPPLVSGLVFNPLG